MTERTWDAVTFDGVRRAQLREQMRLTPTERLRWLEEALQFAAMARRTRASSRESTRAEGVETGSESRVSGAVAD